LNIPVQVLYGLNLHSYNHPKTPRLIPKNL